MYVYMSVYVPGGALRPKCCVIEAPNSPRAAFFSFLIFAAFVLAAFAFSLPPTFLPIALRRLNFSLRLGMC